MTNPPPDGSNKPITLYVNRTGSRWRVTQYRRGVWVSRQETLLTRAAIGLAFESRVHNGTTWDFDTVRSLINEYEAELADDILKARNEQATVYVPPSDNEDARQGDK